MLDLHGGQLRRLPLVIEETGDHRHAEDGM
jgi:hypothetical protein